MFNLMIILLAVINSEINDSNNYKIAKYIIENIDQLEDCSITELAKKCYVSNSSISRFCRDIGLRDYNELKNQVAKVYLTTFRNVSNVTLNFKSIHKEVCAF